MIYNKGSDILLQTRNRLILLHQTPYMTRKMIYKLKEHDPTLQLIFTLTPSEISNFFLLPMKKTLIIYQSLRQLSLSNTLQTKTNKHIKCITFMDEEYPERLSMIPDAPLVLYLMGEMALLHQEPMLSVVGTRKPSSEAMQKLTHTIKPLIESRWIIVSGLAYGIDSLAHQLTVNHFGKTIAVLGSGFSHIYPRAHISLCKRIIKDGLLVSEYPPDIKPRKYHFPERNRIISGLSEGTLVVEAAEKSGTMITVDQALEQGREIFAIPGSPLMEETIGCNRLIQDGAKLVLDASDIIEEWPGNVT